MPLSSRRPPPLRRRGRRPHVRLCLEQLEIRSLLSVSGPAASLLGPCPVGEVQAQQAPDDSDYGRQWNMDRIGAPAAWDVTTGRRSVLVGHVDSGIDYTHPDLRLNLWINQAEIPASRRANLTDVDRDGAITFFDLNHRDAEGNYVNQGPGKITGRNGNVIDARDLLAPMGRDADGRDDGTGGWANGVNEDAAAEGAALGQDEAYTDDLVGWDFWNDDNDPYDDNGHGTHSAGVIGAAGNNAAGVAGLSWAVQLVAVKVIGASNDQGNFHAAADGVRYSAAKGARVANNSWGGPGQSMELLGAISYARDRGQLFVAAAMNSSLDNDSSPDRAYPASYPLDNIIAVAATGDQDQLASWSNYGKTTVHLGAPGVGVWSTAPVGQGGGYASFSGTSAAAPHVTGAAALLLAVNPALGYSSLKTYLLDSVDPVAALRDRTVTGGRLNVARALAAVPPAPVPGMSPPPSSPAPPPPVYVYPSPGPVIPSYPIVVVAPVYTSPAAGEAASFDLTPDAPVDTAVTDWSTGDWIAVGGTDTSDGVYGAPVALAFCVVVAPPDGLLPPTA